MRLIVDTNVLITFFWKHNFFEKMLGNIDIEFFSPSYAIEEIEKHKEYIIDKSKIDNDSYNNIKIKLIDKINFVDVNLYQDFFSSIKLSDDNKDDIDFIALAIVIKGIIWSNDKNLKKQDYALVLSTFEIVDIIE
ncbi:MAG: PIN domain-containing protein [Candidatus Woesearchaeota archaeon]